MFFFKQPFECKSCPKRFTHKNDLSRHELTHTGQETYDCNECDKSFLEKSHLVRHFKTRKHLMKT
jgi:KRAB domain-containing zinc finger protein